jgi:hypothetical protein
VIEDGAPTSGRIGQATSARQYLGMFALVLVPILLAGAGILVFYKAACACGTPAVPSSPVEGVVTSVHAESIDRVRTFTLRTRDGTSWQFAVGALENASEFPPGHLAEHQASSQPVRVFFRLTDGEAVAYRLEDAGG